MIKHGKRWARFAATAQEVLARLPKHFPLATKVVPMEVGYVFAGLVVADRDQAVAWYERLLGRPADMLPNDAEAAWQLVGQASVYLLADPARAGRGVMALVVDDL